MKNIAALTALAGIASIAAAQTATVTVSPSATSIDTSGENRTISVAVTITADTGLTSFDAVVAALEGDGLFTVSNAQLVNPLLFSAIPGISETTNEGPLGIRGFGAGALLSGTDISGQQFTFDLTANAGAVGTVELTIQGSGFSPIATTGLFADAIQEITINTGRISLVPAPSSLALLGLGGLAATRRRR